MTAAIRPTTADLSRLTSPQTEIARSTATTKPQTSQPVDSKLQQAAKEFEAVFLRQMLAALERTTKVGDRGPNIAGQQTYGSMVVEAVADAVANAGGLGMANTISTSLATRVAPTPAGSERTAQPTDSGRAAAPASRPEIIQPHAGTKSADSSQGLSPIAVPKTEIRTTSPTSPGQMADRRIR